MFNSNNVVISAASAEVCAILCAVLVVVYVSLTVVLFVVSLCNDDYDDKIFACMNQVVFNTFARVGELRKITLSISFRHCVYLHVCHI